MDDFAGADTQRERIRMELEDAVARAVESGWKREDIEEEVRYALETSEEDDDEHPNAELNAAAEELPGG